MSVVKILMGVVRIAQIQLGAIPVLVDQAIV